MGKSTRRKSGKRDKSSRLLRPTTRAERNVAPNDRARERMERFSHKLILDGKAGHDVFDGPGQLHAMGYFHNLDHEPKIIRDALREYGELYWYWFASLNTGIATYDPIIGGQHGISSKSSPLPPKAKAERRFQALEELLPASLASPERIALHCLVVDHWGSDSVHPFVDRLVNTALAKLKLPMGGMIATLDDERTLAAGIRAACAMIDGRSVPLELAA